MNTLAPYESSLTKQLKKGHIMIRIYRAILIACFYGLFCLCAYAEDKTQAPYFAIEGSPGEAFPLLSSTAKVRITGNIADVTVTQSYRNEGQSPVEAVYVFPGSTRAAVYGLVMHIADRTIQARIKEKEQAKRDYEQAKQEGKSASLLEQNKPNVFTMNVANILPGDLIRVELHYTETLFLQDKLYEFVYPMSIGPRATNKGVGMAPKADFVEPPSVSGQDPFQADIQVEIISAVPVHQAFSPSHGLATQKVGDRHLKLALEKSDEPIADRDFVLRFSLAGKEIGSGLTLERGDKENFFMLQVEPPERYAADNIPLREYLFIVDVSGSMTGYPLTISKGILQSLLESMREQEKFNILFFAGSAAKFAEQALSATPENIKRAVEFMTDVQAGGSTELLGALEYGALTPPAPGYAKTTVIISDGFVHVEPEAFELVTKDLATSNYFAFGIGNSVNRELIEGIARAGFGEAFFAANEEEGLTQGRALLDTIRAPLLTDIRVAYDGFAVSAVQPRQIPDLFSNRPLLIVGKWQGEPKGTIRISGVTGMGEWQQEISVPQATILADSNALKYIWARREVGSLDDVYSIAGRGDDEVKKMITDLGLSYNLMTDFTSFVAVDTVVRTSEANQKVLQPQASRYGSGQLFPSSKRKITDLKLAGTREEPKKTLKIKDRTFLWIHNAWVDKQHNLTLPTLQIKRGSTAFLLLCRHFPILKELPESANIWIVLNGTTLQITDQGIESAADTRIRPLIGFGKVD